MGLNSIHEEKLQVGEDLVCVLGGGMCVLFPWGLGRAWAQHSVG